ncbi:MAG: hypothetical protein DME22_23815 [Verrucomicrobia bacterium]|nr:MAG: hypothetical protein DME22_23815 [Verrucomicrobiota bacterium]
MTPRLILPSTMVLLLTACGRHSENSPSAPAPAAEPGKSAADAPAVVARSEASGAELAAALGELTQALRKYSFEHQRLPKTFNEVVAAGYVNNMPQAPPGKKFEIEPRTVQVVLVKQ